MFMRRWSRSGGGADFAGFWIPYSDLMAALLGVFALLLIVTVYRMGQPLNEVRDVLEERQTVSQELREYFKDDNRVEITGAGSLRLKGEVLFATNTDSLSDSGRATLLDIMPRYLAVITSRDSFENQLSRVLVEGHADPSFAGDDSLAGYLYNLGLSQRRAASVVTFLMSADRLEVYREFMREYFMASGRSSTDLVFNEATGEPDYERSRRIQIDFLMKDEELVEDLMREMRKNKVLPQ